MAASEKLCRFWLAVALFFALALPWLAAQQKPKIPAAPQWIKLPQEAAATHLIKKAAPVYPAFAKAAGIQGVVSVGVAIYPDGRIHSIGPMLTGWVCLSQSAMTAAGQYVYRSFKKDGQLVGVETTEDIVFKLPGHRSVFHPPPAPQLTLDSLNDFRDATPVVDGPPETRKWLLSHLQKDFTYSFEAKRGAFEGIRDGLPAKMVEIRSSIPASRIYLITDGVVSPSMGRAVLCGATGNCDIWLVEDDAGNVRHGVRSGGFGFYVRHRKGSPYPDIFIASNMSAFETDIDGYVNIGGNWGLLYCGKIMTDEDSRGQDKSDIHVCR